MPIGKIVSNTAYASMGLFRIRLPTGTNVCVAGTYMVISIKKTGDVTIFLALWIDFM